MRVRVIDTVGVILGGNRRQGIGLVAKAREVILRDQAKDAGKAAWRMGFFLDVGCLEQGFADLLVGQRVHLFHADDQSVADASASQCIHGGPDRGRPRGAGVFKPHGRCMAQLRDGDAGERGAEILRCETGVEVGHEHGIDILGFEPRRFDGRQGRVANQLLKIDGVELAERGVAPADDVGLFHDRFFLRVGMPTPEASKPPSTARNWPLMKLAAGLHRKPTALAISSGVP